MARTAASPGPSRAGPSRAGQSPTGESRTALIRRARRIYRELCDLYPDAHSELDFTNPLELLMAVVLSAQTTDRRVNEATQVLFERYRTAADYAAADPVEVNSIIRSVTYHQAKADYLVRIGQMLCERFGGEVPRTIEELVTLPGVGRKTANVVLGNAFGVPGITPDTHFMRLSRRFGWTTSTDPVKIEHEVGELFPKSEWTMLSHRVIFHGRRICHARRPACGACPVAPLCPSYGEGETDPVKARALLKYELAGLPGQRLRPPVAASAPQDGTGPASGDGRPHAGQGA